MVDRDARLAPFGERLAAAIAQRGPLCVGIDPHPELLRAWGLPDDLDGLQTFAATAVSALAPQVAVVKPQSAFFERFGAGGIAVLEDTVRTARDAGALVLLDVKRGDIGSTMTAYAQAYLSPASPLFCDAVTLSPFLGFDALAPALDLARRNGCGVFVLALTSNPEGAAVQHARDVHGHPVAARVAQQAAARNAGISPMGDVGLVVGATVGGMAHALGLDLVAVNGPLLAPGLRAQGATAADLAAVFGPARGQVLPSVSRQVLGAGPEPEALQMAARRVAQACRSALAG